MQKSIVSFSCAIGLAIVGFSQPTLAGQRTTTRTGPYGNSSVTTRTYGHGQKTTTRTGSYGNSSVISIL